MRFILQNHLVKDTLTGQVFALINVNLIINYLNSVTVEYTVHKESQWIKCYKDGKYLSAFEIDTIPF